MLSNAPKSVEKPWGNELLFPHANTQSTVKIMTVMPDKRNSFHFHTQKKEMVHCLEGTGILRVDTQSLKLVPGKTYFISKDQPHRISAFTKLKLLEVSVGIYDENDIVRIEDDYGRV